MYKLETWSLLYHCLAGALRTTGTFTNFLPTKRRSRMRWTHKSRYWPPASFSSIVDGGPVFSSRPISPWPFWMWELQLQGWTQRWGLQWGWQSFRATRSMASMTVFRDWPEERWHFALLFPQWGGFFLGFFFWKGALQNGQIFCLQLFRMEWKNVAGWTGQGGSLLGTKRWASGDLSHYQMNLKADF